MLKRLIEVALPLRELSAEASRDKTLRSGHISTLHIWWARRPLAACRAVVFASLIPDPDDPECPESFRKLAIEVLGRDEFRPKRLGPSPASTTGNESLPLEDTPRNRCLEFVKHLVRWENSNNPDYIEPARKLITAAHKILHPDAEGEGPKVLDPFAGGGAIPLEALRLGCEAHAIELNPVAHLIELCTLVYPQKYGQPNSRPVPDYIKRLIAQNRKRRKAKGEVSLFDDEESALEGEDDESIPDVEITEAEYRKNPLAADVKYWGRIIHDRLAHRLARFYVRKDELPLAYLWSRTVRCSNPKCRATAPLIRQLWLCNKRNRKIALRPAYDKSKQTTSFEVVTGGDITFDPSVGTVINGKLRCPFCQEVSDGKYLRQESIAGRMGQQLIAVVITVGPRGKSYRSFAPDDEKRACDSEQAVRSKAQDLPKEPISPDRPSPNSRGLSAIHRYGFDEFGKMFSPRQALCLLTLTELVRECRSEIACVHECEEYSDAVASYLACAADKVADFSSSFCRWGNDDEGVTGTFGRQAVPMVWDYAEVNPLTDRTGGYMWAIGFVANVIKHCSPSATAPANVQRGSATRIPLLPESAEAVIVDPPYYDSVPYGDLSDYFYVWLKRSLRSAGADLFTTPVTPKREETIAYWGNNERRKVQKPPSWYEEQIGVAFTEMRRVLETDGILAIMFAHKTTTAWETIIEAIGRAGLYCTASWPIHTEGRGRLTSHNAGALASSITLACRKRPATGGSGLWDDVRQELKQVAHERLDFFWNQGIRGADFFISAIGPALSVFGKYERVTKLTGDEVTVGQFLDEVRVLVTGYALEKILHTTHTANIDPESRFYVVWKWSYGEAKVPADESFKLAQALGIDTEMMWDKTGVLEKSGENVQAMPVAKRMKIKNLGDPSPDGTPGSLIDVLHRMCVFREKGDTEGMAEFVARSGQARNHTLWLVAQAVSEILPDGDKEKQLMQGLLNQKEQLERVDEQGRLF